jgi:hypothetical protein
MAATGRFAIMRVGEGDCMDGVGDEMRSEEERAVRTRAEGAAASQSHLDLAAAAKDAGVPRGVFFAERLGLCGLEGMG